MVSFGHFYQKSSFAQVAAPTPCFFPVTSGENSSQKEHFRLAVFVFIKFSLHSVHLTKLQGKIEHINFQMKPKACSH
jgi:hypothetical protein